jgi:SNF2 family DNA or RNA helicase
MRWLKMDKSDEFHSITMKYKEVYKSFPYQTKALSKALKNGNAALFFDPGLGKTKVTIDFYGIKHLMGEVNRVLIVCPVSAVWVWPDEIKKHLPKNIKFEVMVLKGGSPQKRREFFENLCDSNKLTFVISTFDQVKNLLIIKGINKWHPDGIAVDESHYIKHHNSQRSKTLHKLGDIIDSNKVIMSGTAISKNPLSIYSQYRFLDKSIFGTRWSSFRDRYAIMGGYMGYKVVGIKRVKELARKIKNVATRARADKYLPKEKWQVIPFDLKPKTRRIYDKMAKDAVVEFKSGRVSTAEIGATKLIRFQQITGGFLKDEDGKYVHIGDEKIQILSDLLDTLEGRKIVIFARFKKDIKNIKNLCKSKKIKYLTITGDVQGESRNKRRVLFNTDPSYTVMIMQIRTAQSVDLTVANIGIYYSMDYMAENFIQSQFRIRRVNSKDRCVYYVLAARNTVDFSIYRILRKNISISSLILDNYKDIIGGTLSL